LRIDVHGFRAIYEWFFKTCPTYFLSPLQIFNQLLKVYLASINIPLGEIGWTKLYHCQSCLSGKIYPHLDSTKRHKINIQEMHKSFVMVSKILGDLSLVFCIYSLRISFHLCILTNFDMLVALIQHITKCPTTTKMKVHIISINTACTAYLKIENSFQFKVFVLLEHHFRILVHRKNSLINVQITEVSL